MSAYRGHKQTLRANIECHAHTETLSKQIRMQQVSGQLSAHLSPVFAFVSVSLFGRLMRFVVPPTQCLNAIYINKVLLA